MKWGNYLEESKRWKEEGEAYASETNKFVEIGLKDGFENAGDEPIETREDMASFMLDILRKANDENDIEGLRGNFPYAHIPFIDYIEKNKKGQRIESICILTENKYIFRAAGYNKLYLIENNQIKEIQNAGHAGISKDKQVYCISYDNCIKIYKTKNDEDINIINMVDLPGNSKNIIEIIPFEDKHRVLLITYGGVFVLEKDKVVDLYDDYYDESIEERYLSMVHGDISNDDRYIVIGDQDNDHIIFDGSSYERLLEVEPESSYPHYALFNNDSTKVILNSCHFYNGITFQINLENLQEFDEDNKLIIDDGCRVYAAVSLGDGYILGDAYGYIKSYSETGEFKWQYYVGSTITSMDISKDKKTLLVGSYAGKVCELKLDANHKDKYSIGTTNILQENCWIAWIDEKNILRW